MKTTQAEMYAYENCTHRCTLIKATQRCTLMKTTQAEITLMKSGDLAGSLSC